MGSAKTIRTFDGATAIITGGASGIGRALAEELAKRGCEVVLGDRQIALAKDVASAIDASGGKAKAVEANVSNFSAVEQLVHETVERTGRLDYIFNNAGIAIAGDVTRYSIKDWNQILDVNLRGVIHGVQAAYPIMVDQGFGHIINTASMSAFFPHPGGVGYTTTKHAVVGLSISLRAEAASLGVRVSVLCPGVIRTPILEEGGKYGKILVEIPPEQMRKHWEKSRPMPPDIFATKTLRLIAKNKAIIIVPSRWKLFWWYNRLFPVLAIRLIGKKYEEFQNQFGMAEKTTGSKWTSRKHREDLDKIKI
ncbi:SDR family oxidoreductase [candidate division KSB1 bacterium]|nr:SDR family oxidoreductase [candidate division KSB1 bacterium]NIR71205.1 SDR family oxidoreductase [candidate division KSB1 bacterium]NIS23309.1 SDR family oxidoreductase [candidate division KSB1 bacterium]NIT70188.1 SDR family oxidoreductase [candidate division KSB1 bacterium]NIU23840.1 SDR family oxidoreductase [candidate division KSB1 bacterium]